MMNGKGSLFIAILLAIRSSSQHGSAQLMLPLLPSDEMSDADEEVTTFRTTATGSLAPAPARCASFRGVS